MGAAHSNPFTRYVPKPNQNMIIAALAAMLLDGINHEAANDKQHHACSHCWKDSVVLVQLIHQQFSLF